MEEERGSTEVVAKTNEPLITVPNPKAYQSNAVAQVSVASVPGQSKYVQLLGVIEELGRDIRPSYAGSKSSAERIKRGIVHARILTMFTTLDTFDTEYSADSVEWCPTENFRDLFVCGTYQLVPGESASSPGVSSSGQTRLGRIYLHRVMPSGKLHLVQSLNTSAILDMKWARVERPRDSPLLGVVDSIGCLQIYRLTRGDEGEPRLELATHRRICDASETDVLALSLDWDTRRNADSADEFRLVVSDSRGGVSMYSFVPNSELVEVCAAKKLHDFEAWITAFDYWCPNIVYSGGDDCKFHRLDSRMGLKSTACIRKHEAGVTSMHSNAAREYILATGSYDEMLRLWDTRNFRAPISETNLHGGVWRLKWDPHNHTKLFAACMYGGFRVIDCSAESSPQIIAEYNEHGSIAYGCDWSYLDNLSVSSKILGEDPKNVALAATCSFYDHTLKISRLDIQSN